MLTRYGFIGAFDTGSWWENTQRLRERVERGEVGGRGFARRARRCIFHVRIHYQRLPLIIDRFMGEHKYSSSRHQPGMNPYNARRHRTGNDPL